MILTLAVIIPMMLLINISTYAFKNFFVMIENLRPKLLSRLTIAFLVGFWSLYQPLDLYY